MQSLTTLADHQYPIMYQNPRLWDSLPYACLFGIQERLNNPSQLASGTQNTAHRSYKGIFQSRRVRSRPEEGWICPEPCCSDRQHILGRRRLRPCRGNWCLQEFWRCTLRPGRSFVCSGFWVNCTYTSQHTLNNCFAVRQLRRLQKKKAIRHICGGHPEAKCWEGHRGRLLGPLWNDLVN